MDATIQDFKSQFPMNFPYLPIWEAGKAYNENDVVFFETNQNFYTSLISGNTQEPTDPISWALNTSAKLSDYVSDSQILNAFNEARIVFNESLFGSPDAAKMAFLYGAAHYLAFDIKTINGINSWEPFMVESSRKAGDVSVNNFIPSKLASNPRFSLFMTTPFGQKFLSLMAPYLVGRGFCVNYNNYN